MLGGEPGEMSVKRFAQQLGFVDAQFFSPPLGPPPPHCRQL
jgi:hypothetical protein